jgi:chemotaxis methyl-accepting protein methylase
VTTAIHHVATPPATAPLVLDSEVSEIRLLLQEYAGVVIDRPSEALAEMVAEFLRTQHLNSAAELIAALRAHAPECDALLEVLLPGDTAFFRQPAVFEVFRRELLPAIAAGKSAETMRPLRIWSAGCSTGEEAYCIGISVCEALKDNSNWNAHIVAADVRRGALQVAERGLYPASALLQVPANLVASYFSKVGDHLLAKPRLRNLVTFAHINLMQPAFIGRFDCIFCLNLLPHLSASAREAVLRRFHLSLEPGGYLLLGECENIPAGLSLTRHHANGCTYYQRPLAAAAKIGSK